MEALLCINCGAENSEFDSRCAACDAPLPTSSRTPELPVPATDSPSTRAVPPSRP